jgi:putative endonuclease
MIYYVYVLENQNDKSFYIGFTNNLKRRLFEHQNQKGGRTTKLKDNWKLIYFEGYLTEKDAVGREKFLKSGSGRKYLKKQLTHYLNSK